MDNESCVEVCDERDDLDNNFFFRTNGDFSEDGIEELNGKRTK